MSDVDSGGKASVDWQIRPYQPGDEAQAVALFERCFARSMSEAQYRWKIQIGRGAPTNCMLAVAGERIVGQYAGWRVDVMINGQPRQLMVAIDGMVDPDYRRQGILTALVNEAHLVWQSEGVVCVLAMPNEQWGSVNEKVGWRKAFPLKWQIRPVEVERIAMRRLGLRAAVPAPFSWLWNRYWDRLLRSGNGIKVEPVSEAGAIFDELWERLRHNWPLSINRDATWINWRYLSVPDRPYELLLARRKGQPMGYIVYWLQSFSGGQAGMVVDFLYDPADSEVRDGLMSAVLGRLKAVGAESLIGLAIPGTAESDYLKQIGGIFSWGAFDVWILPFDDDISLAFLNQPRNWLMNGGDFDVV